MPSTYSTLKIQLMATGENATTWGTITNTNLGTTIEEAIIASAEVPFDGANVILTLTNTNATQTARHARLVCTGNTGGARTLQVPAIGKPYLIVNQCADPITVKNATGDTYPVPAGKSAFVYSTGTGVFDALNYMGSLALGAPLPVTSGGTGATTTAGVRAAINAASAGANNDITSLTGLTTPLAATQGGTGFASYTIGDMLYASGGSVLAKLSAPAAGTIYSNGVATAPSWGILPVTAGGTGAGTASGARSNLGAQETLVSGTNIKTINGSSILGSGNLDTSQIFPAGTKMLFVQSSAPTGWTKDTTQNDKALRVVSGSAGTGGSVAFSSAFTSQTAGGTVGGTALTASHIPSHFHYVVSNVVDGTRVPPTSANAVARQKTISGDSDYELLGSSSGADLGRSSSVGSGAVHTHTFTGTAIDLSVQYVDVIICTKN